MNPFSLAILYNNSLVILPGLEPGIYNGWQRKYSLIPDTDFKYNINYTEDNTNGNPIILLNDKYYLSTNKSIESTLDNGIIIYINKIKRFPIKIYVIQSIH